MRKTVWHESGKIDGFAFQYDFLSNFYPVEITWRDRIYLCVEAAYQASKLPHDDMRASYSEMTGTQAKKASKFIKTTSTWHEESMHVMEKLLTLKFQREDLKRLLADTGDKELIEGNLWHDNFWGVCHCTKCMEIEGHNHLGKLLMKTRERNNHVSH